MALSCKEVVELVTDYLEGALDAASAAEVQAHLALCEGCETYVQQMRDTAAALGGLDVDTLPGDVQEDLLAAFRAYHPRG
ncbi:MAG: zf-HC2 domain-containing protein [Intrasporangium sp.]|uniref:anti-sigma factor family protein n=1 Tax=Intrasporangium sp. TaxID=1925024 RepID=UPI002647AB7A|nr:zf-HC2 domain-containing protein [Intrasporangium sp.]MDN5797249.1 zf-HC2 domain-containing protein [Intrasporangium sp.]